MDKNVPYQKVKRTSAQKWYCDFSLNVSFYRYLNILTKFRLLLKFKPVIADIRTKMSSSAFLFDKI